VRRTARRTAAAALFPAVLFLIHCGGDETPEKTAPPAKAENASSGSPSPSRTGSNPAAGKRTTSVAPADPERRSAPDQPADAPPTGVASTEGSQPTPVHEVPSSPTQVAGAVTGSAPSGESTAMEAAPTEPPVGAPASTVPLSGARYESPPASQQQPAGEQLRGEYAERDDTTPPSWNSDAAGAVLGSVDTAPQDTGSESEGEAPVRERPRSSHSGGGGGGSGSPSSDTTPETEPPPVPTLQMLASPAPARAGDRVVLQVRIEDATSVRGVPFHLVYPPDLLQFETGAAGPFLAGGGADLTFMADGPPGRLMVALTQHGSTAGAIGSGVLCTLEFRALAPGNARIQMDDLHVFLADRSEVSPINLPLNLTIQ